MRRRAAGPASYSPRRVDAAKSRGLPKMIWNRDVQSCSLEQLRCGDVLLSQGNFTLSRLMAWNAECPYSHAAIMVGADCYAEARPPRVRRRPIAELLASRDRLRFVDVWRPVNPDGRELSLQQRRRIAELASRWLDWPFASYTKMGWLALQTLLRNKLGTPQWRLPAPRDAGVSCTEFVFRVLRPVLGLQPAVDRAAAAGGGAGPCGSGTDLEPQAVITGDLCASIALRPCGRLDLRQRAQVRAANPWTEVMT
jgi:hypothetical protein